MLLLNVAVVVLVNLVGSMLYFRADMTRDRVYVLSQTSQDAVAGLVGPLNVKVFFSESLPAPYNSVGRYLEDVLQEYAQKAGSGFHFEFVDVEREPEAPNTYGIPSIRVREIRDDEVKFRKVFMGLAVIYEDRVERVKALTEAGEVEFALTTRIKAVRARAAAMGALEKPIRMTLYRSAGLPFSNMDGVVAKLRDVVDKLRTQGHDQVEFSLVTIESGRDGRLLSERYGVEPTVIALPGIVPTEGGGLMFVGLDVGGRAAGLDVLSRHDSGRLFIDVDGLGDAIGRAISRLVGVRSDIGYITGHNERRLADDGKGGAKRLNDLLSDLYQVETIDLSKRRIPDDVGTIIVNGPTRPFGEPELRELDRFLMTGRSALFLLDAFTDRLDVDGGEGGRAAARTLNEHGLNDLLAHYGVAVSRSLVLDERSLKSRSQEGERSAYFAPVIAREAMDQSSEITRGIDELAFLHASSLHCDEAGLQGRGVKATVLARTSERSWTLPEGTLNSPHLLKPPQPDEMHVSDLALMLSGGFQSFFHKGASAKPGANLLVVSTSELGASVMLDGKHSAGNRSFLLNSVDVLTGNVDIPQLRSKGRVHSPLQEVDRARRASIKSFNVLGLPLLVIMLGLLVWRLSVARRVRIRDEFS